MQKILLLLKIWIALFLLYLNILHQSTTPTTNYLTINHQTGQLTLYIKGIKSHINDGPTPSEHTVIGYGISGVYQTA